MGQWQVLPGKAASRTPLPIQSPANDRSRSLIDFLSISSATYCWEIGPRDVWAYYWLWWVRCQTSDRLLYTGCLFVYIVTIRLVFLYQAAIQAGATCASGSRRAWLNAHTWSFCATCAHALTCLCKDPLI